ncbi:MAG TPA: hypothetical protein VKE96_08455 [Vicinamibacterales bacterium]|nr:hypothetical protein [Vicinamibacterales bacterium]
MRNTLLMIATSTLLVRMPLRAQPRGDRATVTGEVVDLWCYLEGGDRGPAKKQCATACAKAGNPIGILDSAGNLYVASGLKDHQPAHTMLLGRMSDEVTVSGTVVKKGGIQMIYIDAVK